jgi:hypothetical protein
MRPTPQAHAQPVVPQQLSPGWYPNPSGASGATYWDGQRWQTAAYPSPAAGATSNSRAGRSTGLFVGLGIGLAVVLVGTLLFVLLRDKESSPPPLSSESSSPTAQEISAPPSNGPGTAVTVAPPTGAPPPQQTVWSGIVVGTCDEGGSCGVKQRNAPYVAAARLVPTDLRDGDAVTVVCQTNGDLRSSEGHGSSYVWYRLENGAYVNSVYVNISATGIPGC